MAEQKQQEVISKMSVKAIGCEPRKVAAIDKPADGSVASLILCTIFGIASGLKHGENRNDGSIWTCLTGDFMGVNLQDGKQFRSGKLFLPGGIQEVLEGPLLEAETKDENVSIKFGFRISAVKADNPIGYSYRAAVLLQPSENDPLAELGRLLAAPTAPAPEPPTASAPNPAPAPAQTEAPKATGAARRR